MRLAIVAALLAATVSATRLFVADYSGNVTPLSLEEKGGKYQLEKIGAVSKCGKSPSWLTIDSNRGLLFCMDEGDLSGEGNGTLNSFTIGDDGKLQPVQQAQTIIGPVNGAIFGHASGKRHLAVSHYAGSVVTTYELRGGGRFRPKATHRFGMDKPGPVADRQKAPFEHQALLDPTGRYLVIPDLGADLLRIFRIDPKTLMLQDPQFVILEPGFGPRHGVFWNQSGVTGGTTYFYLVGELASRVTSFRVGYQDKGQGIAFDKVASVKAVGTAKGNYPAEIAISPDGHFLSVSNRRDPEQKNADSDSLSTFKLSPDGKLTPAHNQPVGAYPRHFSFNAAGTLAAVGLQKDNAVKIFRRDTVTGKLGDVVANMTLAGEVTCVQWDEHLP